MNIVKTSFRYHRIVILLVTVLMMGGAYALKFINKNEFPDCTVRQGIVVAVCPGATAEQVEQGAGGDEAIRGLHLHVQGCAQGEDYLDVDERHERGAGATERRD